MYKPKSFDIQVHDDAIVHLIWKRVEGMEMYLGVVVCPRTGKSLYTTQHNSLEMARSCVQSFLRLYRHPEFSSLSNNIAYAV